MCMYFIDSLLDCLRDMAEAPFEQLIDVFLQMGLKEQQAARGEERKVTS